MRLRRDKIWCPSIFGHFVRCVRWICTKMYTRKQKCRNLRRLQTEHLAKVGCWKRIRQSKHTQLSFLKNAQLNYPTVKPSLNFLVLRLCKCHLLRHLETEHLAYCTKPNMIKISLLLYNLYYRGVLSPGDAKPDIFICLHVEAFCGARD